MQRTGPPEPREESPPAPDAGEGPGPRRLRRIRIESGLSQFEPFDDWAFPQYRLSEKTIDFHEDFPSQSAKSLEIGFVSTLSSPRPNLRPFTPPLHNYL